MMRDYWSLLHLYMYSCTFLPFWAVVHLFFLQSPCRRNLIVQSLPMQVCGPSWPCLWCLCTHGIAYQWINFMPWYVSMTYLTQCYLPKYSCLQMTQNALKCLWLFPVYIRINSADIIIVSHYSSIRARILVTIPSATFFCIPMLNSSAL